MTSVASSGFGGRLGVSGLVSVILMLYLSAHGYIPFLMSVDTAGDTEGTVGITAQALFLVVVSVLVLPYAKRLRDAMRFAAPVLALAVFSVLSTAWSQDPGITFRRSVMLLGPTLFALFLHVRFGYRQQLHLLLLTGISAAALSLAICLMFPNVGLDPSMHDGSWQGIFPQKNVCARACVFLTLPAVVLWGRSVKWTPIATLAVLLLGALLFKAHSATGLILMGVAVLATLSMRLLRKLRANESLVLCTVLIACAIAGLSFLASKFADVALIFGKDSTLTGRTAIWAGAVEAVLKHPVLGYGYSAFWLGLRGESANIVLATKWMVPTAHEGFLDLLLQLGAVGLGLFSISLWQGCSAAVWCLRHVGWEAAEWAGGIMLMTILYNLDETSVLLPRELLWVLYCLAFVNLRTMMFEARSRRAERVHRVAADIEPLVEVSWPEPVGVR
jgi:exopolysaccharide production protein ExoQ